ncbi:FAD-binding oxidoreductase [Siculibacillus lacustris]|uniref:FAD-binding oxidoreductase n=1 Tax=Siculibacillus lacustris TaxID=1549641 RepID=A0A4V2KUA6_9HYPH|nr:FAD-dependent oxidoreductase [Siculibacillus lacustris]TBW40698.1 FAD-binding oxidoreductase [Siculibacillus lacustris]
MSGDAAAGGATIPDFPPSLWAAVTPPRAVTTSLAGEVRADVAVIGAGFTGLTTALRLAERGRSVVIVEAAAVGWGASGRNNGQVIPTMTGAEPDAMARRFGAVGERFAQLVADSAQGLFDLIREKGIACEAVQNGWFQPAHSPGRVKLSAMRVEAWARRGAPVRLLDKAETATLIGSTDWYGGMLNASGGHVNPLALARGLADAAVAAGARLYEATPATGIERTSAGWVVTTPQGRVIVDQVMLASNGYTDAFVPDLQPRIAHSLVPVTSWQMATAPQPEAIRATVLPGRQALSDTHGDLRFFRWDARGRLVTGGALMVPFDGAARLQKLVGERLAKIFPQMGVPTFDYVWNGRIGMTADRMPRFHAVAPGLWAWCACNGRGVALSVALGQVFADAIAGTAPADLAVPLTAVRPLPFHGIGTRVAPLMLGWYRFKDSRELA